MKPKSSEWADPLDSIQTLTDTESQSLNNGFAKSREISPEDAREAIERERQDRIQSCSAELEVVLKTHRCRLDVSVILREGQVIPAVNIIAED